MRSLIITGKLATYDEYVYPLYRLRELGDVDVAVRDRETVYGELKGYGGALVHAGPIVPTRDIPGILEAGYYDLLVLPGGAKAMEYLRQDKGLISFISEFHIAGGMIASICHAAQLLISAKLVKGRKISGYYSIKDDIENAGGIFVDAPAVYDGNIVSSPHYKYMAEWMSRAIAMVLPDKVDA